MATMTIQAWLTLTAKERLRTPHTYRPMGDAIRSGVSATCADCGANALTEAHEASEREGRIGEAKPTCDPNAEDCEAGWSTLPSGHMPEVSWLKLLGHDVIELRQVARGVEPQTIRLTKRQAAELVRVLAGLA